jgi:hypothetical protein
VEALFSFFDEILGSAPQRQHTIDLDLLDLPELHFPELGDQFTKQEVLQVIRALPPDKALGLDDFSARFIQSTWEIIKPEIMSAFHTFWYLNVWNFQENNGVLLFLLPKTPDAAAIKDYQPISLIHIFGKLF